MKPANKTSFLPFALATTAALLVSVSGCSDRNRDIVEASGLAIDGYLQSATVCVDINRDKQCSDNEPRDTTDANARFALGTFTPAPLVVEIKPGVTTESSTQGGAGDAITEDFFLSAPFSSSSITPLTTLVQVGVEQGIYPDFAAGASAVATALNIPAGTDIQHYDYLGAGDTKVAVAAEIVTAAIADAIVNIETNVTGIVATTEDILETAVKVLIDPDLAGGAGTSLMTEIGIVVDTTVDDGLLVKDIDIAVLVATVETAIETNIDITVAADVLAGILEAAVEVTHTINETEDATGATGSST